MSKRFSVRIFAGMIAGALLAPSLAFAQSPELQTAVTIVDQSIDKLLSSQTPFEEASRKALDGVYALTKEEIKELREKLTLVHGDTIESELVVIRESYDRKLADALKDVEKEQLALSDAQTTLLMVQEMAESFKTWREETLSPLTKGVFDLTFLFQGKGILKIADARFGKINGDVTTLQMFYGADRVSVLRPYLSSAASHLKTARSLTNQAYELLLDNFSLQYPGILTRHTVTPPSDEETAAVLDAVTPDVGEQTEAPQDPSLEVVPNEVPSSTLPVPSIEPALSPTVQSRMEKALKEMSAMYKDFLQMIAVAKEQKLIK